MSQKVSRKTAVSEEKETKQTDSPVKDMKKRVAANAEKEKQAAEKASEKSADKKVEKPTEKKTDKPADKKADKTTEKKAEKSAEKIDKPAEKAAEKSTDKTEKEKSDKQEKPEPAKSSDKKNEKSKDDHKKSEPQAEKSKADGSKEDKSEKPEKPDTKKPDPPKQKQNGRDRVHNGVSDVTLGTNGTDDVLNGTVSADSEDDDVMLVIDDTDDNDHDELFPELTYEDNSDVECFEVPTPENGPSRSLTRRSQVKSTRTPETPRPASDKPTDKDADDPKDKVLKLKEDAHTTTDRRLRSSNSPKPQEGKKPESKKDSPKKSQEGLEKVEEGKEEEAAKSDEKSQESKEVEVEITVEVQGNEGEEVRKTDTNYSKSRVKVSPYRRSIRIADQTNTSVQANYTGNNTTMEMDITESSSFMEDTPLDDSSYLRGLRSIRGRSSYKPLKELSLKHVNANRSLRSNASTSVTSPASDSHNRPTGTVVGRKRKPDNDDVLEVGVELTEPSHGATKRMRVLERLAGPFRRVAAAAALPAAARRNAEIVGINTDLPLSAPVSSTDTFDPESLKPAAPLSGLSGLPPLAGLAPLSGLAPLAGLSAPLSSDPVAVPLPPRDDRDNKRCAIM